MACAHLSRPGSLLRAVALLTLAAAPCSHAAADPKDAAAFDQKIKPLLKEYCLTCHSTEKQKGELDLEVFATLDEVRKHPKIWQGVAEQLANQEMPPKKKPQFSEADKALFTNWVASTLDTIARERAGDPGPVVLRRLSNSEYTYTVRDLTGVQTLDPAKEFPVDGAAGEGFTNTGQSLVMSPSLVSKYLDAGKAIASHAVFLPDGLRFSPSASRRDWTEEVMTQIRGFYREFTDSRGSDKVNLQGIVFETNEGGRLPLEKYFAATLVERAALTEKQKTIEAVAKEHGINAKYLGTLWAMLNATEPSPLLDELRARWRTAKPEDAVPLAAEVAKWQKVLWKFNSVGQLGKRGGATSWLEAVSPIVEKQEVKLKLTAPANGDDVTLYLVADDAGDGNDSDYVIWEQPRLVAPGRPVLLLRDVRAVARDFAERRERTFAKAAQCLAAAGEASTAAATGTKVDVAALAQKHAVDPAALGAWLDYLGIAPGTTTKVEGYFKGQLPKGGAYDFIKGWGVGETPNLVANSSGEQVRVPGIMKPHSVAMHPSPTLQAAVGWRSPVTGPLRISGAITHAHPECGNGVTWSVELRRGGTRQRLATGVSQGGKPVPFGPLENLSVQTGDLISVLIGPRDGNHSCDLTAVDFTLTSAGEKPETWDLAADVSPNILAGNPHADKAGREGIWHFYSEPEKGATGPVIPAGSVLAKWQSAATAAEKAALADAVQKLLTSAKPTGKDSPDAKLYQELTSLGGPLFSGMGVPPMIRGQAPQNAPATPKLGQDAEATLGLDPALFGKHPAGAPVDSSSLCVKAPAIVEVRLPAALVAGCEFVTSGAIHGASAATGSAQLQVLTQKPAARTALQPGVPIVMRNGSSARARMEKALAAYRDLFPAALCYAKIVPVDEVITLTLFHREDDQLARLMLDDAQKAKLDRLWDELRYISGDALTLVDAFAQLLEYASQDADPSVLFPLRQPIMDRAAAYRHRLVETEPQHLAAVLEFANRAYRRPITTREEDELRALYRKLRTQELPHDEAIRLLLARVLVSPAFLYRTETPGPQMAQIPVTDAELANRLSYFLWASQPDAALREAAASGKLHDPAVLAAQTKRMLGDARVRRLATEFACQWLHIRDFDTLDEKSERHFPTFGALKGAMYEESIRFFTDFFQSDGSVLGILSADHTFLNEDLAKHYGIPNVKGPEWRRVDGLSKYGRSGILGQATTLAKQSGASRTSPILRGNWVAEVLLGDRLPRPPKDVPQLPEDEATETLTMRELTVKHTSDARCAGCHARIDPYGFSLEGFDAIGRSRTVDLGNRPIDTKSKVLDGAQIEGLFGLRDYLVNQRQDAFIRQFNRKLLGYALGRGILLSDEPLLAEMRDKLKASNFKIRAAIESIVRSRQFQDIRGKEFATAE